MLRSLPFRNWESKSALLAHLESCGSKTLVVRLPRETPRHYLSLSLPFTSGEGVLELGVHCHGFGIAPVCLVFEKAKRALVAADSTIASIDLEAISLANTIELVVPFYEFLPTGKEDEVLVVHELGAMRIDARGTILWRVETSDIVVSSTTDGRGNLVLGIWEEREHLLIDAVSGLCLPIESTDG